VGECALQFQISQLQKNGNNTFIGIKDVFVKGNQCKTTLTTAQLVQSFIFNTQLDKGYVLKDIGQNHFLQTIDYPPATKLTIVSSAPIPSDSLVKRLGYSCKLMQLVCSDGSVYDIEYTEDLSLTVNQFEWVFKDVPGLVLFYTITKATGLSFKYEATKIDLSPLSLSIFTVNRDIYQAIDER